MRDCAACKAVDIIDDTITCRMQLWIELRTMCHT